MYRLMTYLAIVTAAMLMGLLITLFSVFRPMWNSLNDRDAATAFQDFLRHAGTNRALSTMTIAPIVSAIVISFSNVPESARKYALIGGGVFFVGFFVWTAVFNLPIYRTVAGWELRVSVPSDTRAVIARFHKVNLGRFVAALATTIFFSLPL